MNTLPFKVGDQVTWTSQSGSYVKTKIGTVISIIPKGARPSMEILPGAGWGRDHPSYLVSVPGKTARAKGKLYWPNVKHLRASGAA